MSGTPQTSAPPPASPATSATSLRARFAAQAARLLKHDRLLLLNLAFFTVLWLLLFSRLRTEWIVNELYSYGWAVPFLALFLFLERWRERPPPAAARPHPLWLVIPASLILAYAPIRLINEANPDWVKINFLMTTLVVASSFCALFAIGRLRYVRHFAFPLLFVYTALPWPVMVEENLVQTLTRWNTLVSAESLTFLGLPAIATGNIIQVGQSLVNVADACSGIRSLQTAFMMSLFLGEFYRLGWLSRALLMLSSFAVAFGLNIGRTMTLSWINSAHGSDAMERWHDPVGYIVMIGCLAGLWLLALAFERLRKNYGDHTLLAALTVGKTRPPETRQSKIQSSFERQRQSAKSKITAPFPFAFVVFSLAAILFAEIGTESWYRYHEAHLAPPPEWTINWPRDARGFEERTFPDRTRAILKYNEGQTCSWTTPEGYSMQMYAIRWLPGRVSKFLSGAHYPTVCLPATGLKFQRETGAFNYHAGPVEVPFATFLFEYQGRPVYVFHAIVEDRPAPDRENIDYRQVTSTERIDSVLRGHRNLGQRVIGISIYGAATLDDAEESLRATLPKVINITPAAAATAYQNVTHTEPRTPHS